MRKFKRFGITAGMSLIAALSAATTVSAKNLSEFSDTNNNYTRGLYYDAAYGESYDTKDKSRPYTTSLINNVNNELSCDEAEEALIRCEVVSADSAYDDLELYNQANISLDNGHKIYDLYCLIQKNVFCFFSNKEQNRVFKNGFVVLDDLFDSNTVTVVCMCSEQEYEDFKELRDDKNLANASLYGRSSSDRYMCNYSNGILTYVEYYDKKDSYNAPEAEIDDTEIDYSNIDEETLNDPDFIDKFSETHPDSLPLSGLDVNVHYSDNKVVKKFNKCAITDVEEECFDENVSAFAEEYLDQGHKLYNLNMLTRENVFNF